MRVFIALLIKVSTTSKNPPETTLNWIRTSHICKEHFDMDWGSISLFLTLALQTHIHLFLPWRARCTSRSGFQTTLSSPECSKSWTQVNIYGVCYLRLQMLDAIRRATMRTSLATMQPPLCWVFAHLHTTTGQPSSLQTRQHEVNCCIHRSKMIFIHIIME